MLSKLRNFSTTKLAGVFVFIIAIPFVFWGMGGVFSSGNTNSIAKINNYNVSTKDFINYINETEISEEYIKENINNNILEELLTELISNKLVDLETKNLNIIITEKNLATIIRANKNFQDEQKKFSRIKYEKFLLENNLNVVSFENKIKKNFLKRKLFTYIAGGIKAPYFITNNTFKNENKLITLSYVNLDNFYKKKENFSNIEIDSYINENEESLKKEIIDFKYVKITPENLVQETEYTNNFFAKIDEIENQILNGYNIEQVANNFKLKLDEIDNFTINTTNQDLVLKEIYKKRNENKIQIIEKKDYFLLYEINNLKKILPKKTNVKFIETVKDELFKKNKAKYNSDLLYKIQNKEFTIKDFNQLVKNDEFVKLAYLENVNDENLFTLDSMKLIYSLPKRSFLLVADEAKNIYLAKIDEIYEKDILKGRKDFLSYNDKANNIIKENLYSSFNYLMNDKYKINVNQRTLDRVKNYFQ